MTISWRPPWPAWMDDELADARPDVPPLPWQCPNCGEWFDHGVNYPDTKLCPTCYEEELPCPES